MRTWSIENASPVQGHRIRVVSPRSGDREDGEDGEDREDGEDGEDIAALGLSAVAAVAVAVALPPADASACLPFQSSSPPYTAKLPYT